MTRTYALNPVSAGGSGLPNLACDDGTVAFTLEDPSGRTPIVSIQGINGGASISTYTPVISGTGLTVVGTPAGKYSVLTRFADGSSLVWVDIAFAQSAALTTQVIHASLPPGATAVELGAAAVGIDDNTGAAVSNAGATLQASTGVVSINDASQPAATIAYRITGTMHLTGL